jgi:replicative superfamily II helicase
MTLYDLLPREDRITNDLLLGRFLDYLESRPLTLYPAQEEAVLELFEEKNVILNTPTGSGKSLLTLSRPARTLQTRNAHGSERPLSED